MSNKKVVVHKHYSSGIGIGGILAVVISYKVNQSILWALLHGFLGWFYVIYAALQGYIV